MNLLNGALGNAFSNISRSGMDIGLFGTEIDLGKLTRDSKIRVVKLMVISLFI